MKVQLKRLTLDFACCYILSIHFSTKLADSKKSRFANAGFFFACLSVQEKACRNNRPRGIAFHSLQFQAQIISLKFFLILQSVLVINKIDGLLRRDSCREKSVCERNKSHQITGWWHLYFKVASELRNQSSMSTTSLFQIFSFSYSDLHC